MFIITALQVVAAQGQRHANYARQPAISAAPAEQRLRLTRQQINQLTDEYHLARAGVRRDRTETAIEVFLDYLAGGGYYRQVGFSHGVATSTAYNYTHDVVNYLHNTAADHISLPNPNEFHRLGSDITALDGTIKNIILYIDGVIIRIQRPDNAGDAYYCGRNGKSCDSLNVQYVVDKDGVVRHVIAGIPGSAHDKTAADWSGELRTFLDRLPANTVMLGDAAYRNLHPQVIVPFSGQLTPAQRIFNNSCTSLRQIVERTIGATELKWRMEQLKENRYPAKGGPLFASKCAVATCVLHNRFTNYLS
jgi:hypothetical protein